MCVQKVIAETIPINFEWSRKDGLIDGCRMPSCNSTGVGLLRISTPNIKPKCCDGATTSLRWPRWPPRRLLHTWGISWKGWGILVVISWDLENQKSTQFWVGEIESTTSKGNPLVTGGVVFDETQVTIYMHFLVPTFNLPVTVSYESYCYIISFSIYLMASFNHKVSMRIRYYLTHDSLGRTVSSWIHRVSRCRLFFPLRNFFTNIFHHWVEKFSPNDTASWHAKRLGVPKLPRNLELLQKNEDFRNWGPASKNPCNGEGFWVGVWFQKKFGSNNKT